MFAIAVLGAITVTLAIFMAVRPAIWGQGILLFAHSPYFHVAEISLRMLAGLVLLAYSHETKYPAVFASLGYLMFGVAVFLVALGEARHRRFAIRSATFIRIFRPAGLLAGGFGIFTVTSTIGN